MSDDTILSRLAELERENAELRKKVSALSKTIHGLCDDIGNIDVDYDMVDEARKIAGVPDEP